MTDVNSLADEEVAELPCSRCGSPLDDHLQPGLRCPEPTQEPELAREYADDGSTEPYPWFRCAHGVPRPDYCPVCERDKKWPVKL